MVTRIERAARAMYPELFGKGGKGAGISMSRLIRDAMSSIYRSEQVGKKKD